MTQLKDMESGDQVRLAAKIFEIQDHERATRAAVERALRVHGPEIMRRAQQIVARKRQPVYTPATPYAPSGGMITSHGAYIPYDSSEGMLYRNAPHLRTIEERLRCGCSECQTLLGDYGQGYKRFR